MYMQVMLVPNAIFRNEFNKNSMYNVSNRMYELLESLLRTDSN